MIKTLGGIGGCSSVGLGYRDDTDIVRNEELAAGTAGTILVDYDLDDDLSGESHQVYVYLDGELNGTADVNGTDLPPLGSGDHDVDLFVVRNSELAPVYYLGDSSVRAVLCWGAVAASDLAGYNVYSNEGSGAADTLLDTVTTFQADLGLATLSGSGTGTVKIFGQLTDPPDGENYNDTWALVVNGSGQFQVDQGSGAAGDARTIAQGGVYNIAAGLKARFRDAASTYAASARYEFFVGRRTWYVTEEIASATAYAVSAYDIAGNESSLSSELTITPDPWPEPPTDHAIAWDATAREVTITWTDPVDASVDYVEVWTNYDEFSDTLYDYVDMDGYASQASVPSAGSLTITVASGVTGDFLAYVRSYDATTGRREANATLLRVELTADTESATLGTPELVSATQLAGRKARLVTQVDLRDATPVNLRVYFNTTNTWTGATFAFTVPWAPDSTSPDSFPFVTMTWDSGVYSGTRYWGVRTEDASGNPSPQSELIAVTADDTAPSAPSWC